MRSLRLAAHYHSDQCSMAGAAWDQYVTKWPRAEATDIQLLHPSVHQGVLVRSSLGDPFRADSQRFRRRKANSSLCIGRNGSSGNDLIAIASTTKLQMLPDEQLDL
jgi:hypothetical protein